MLKSQAHLSQLVLVDMQVKLAGVMQAQAMSAVLKNSTILLQAAQLLELTCMATEQYPQGLGHTLPALVDVWGNLRPIPKTSFSCMHTPQFRQQLTRDHTQVVLMGMESHICVLQTALDLLAAGKQVFVVEDAVISRNPLNQANAIVRMRDAGCVITNTESVAFEWLGTADAPAFKAISKLIR